MSQEHRSPTRLPAPVPSSRPQQDHEVKRRGLLPQRSGQDTTGQRSKLAVQQGTGNGNPSSKPSTSRSSAKRTLKKPEPVSGASTQGPARPTPASTSLDRSTSVRRPGTLPGPSRGGITRTHVRNDSTNTLGGIPKPSTAGSVGTQDPVKRQLPTAQRAPQSEDGNRAIPGCSDAPIEASQRLATAVSAHKRAAAPKSGQSRTVHPIVAAEREKPVPTTPNIPRRGRDAAEDDAQQPSRPAFSTLQQHYSPKKPTKSRDPIPMPSAPSQDASGQLSAGTLHLQAELLQLHLLHERSAATEEQWERSAERKLRRKFDATTAAHRALRAKERRVQEHASKSALQEWAASTTSLGFAEDVQTLAAALREPPALLAGGGRYARLADEYEAWIDRSGIARGRRGPTAADEPDALRLARGLGDAWKAENASLTRKLAVLARSVERVAPPAEGSGIAAVLGCCRGLLGGMLAGLRTMLEIEAEVVAWGKERVEADLAAVARDMEASLDVGHADDGSWREW